MKKEKIKKIKYDTIMKNTTLDEFDASKKEKKKTFIITNKKRDKNR